MKTHNLTAWSNMPTSGRFVYKGRSSGLWYWQDDMCESDGGDGGYPDMRSAFAAALEHAITCPHRNFNRR